MPVVARIHRSSGKAEYWTGYAWNEDRSKAKHYKTVKEAADACDSIGSGYIEPD